MSATAVKDVLVILASGIAILIGLVILVYIILLVLDRYCCCCPWWNPVGDFDPAIFFSAGRIEQEARLVGITSAERRQILEKVLISKTYAETCAARKANNASNNDEAATATERGGETLEASFQNENAANTTTEEEGYNESTCAICINDYGQEDIVMHGTSCQHIFHKECLLEWLDKHDVCPTCRKDMMTSDEFKNAAKSVLNAERANEIASLWSNNVPLPNGSAADEIGEGNAVVDSDNDNALEMAELGGAEASENMTIAQPPQSQTQQEAPIAQEMQARTNEITATTSS
mmetsp:Transcript_16978/g.23300  ORF Transcript_16978/g.23300 Transcript_16978/m.23300 type:complete len:290 (-) Transcript_16978:311-1180(-)